MLKKIEVMVQSVKPPRAGKTNDSGLITLAMLKPGYTWEQTKPVEKYNFLNLHVPHGGFYEEFTKRFPVRTRFISAFELGTPSPRVMRDEDGEVVLDDAGKPVFKTTEKGEVIINTRADWASNAPVLVTQAVATVSEHKVDPNLKADPVFDLATLAEPAPAAQAATV